MIHEQKCYGAVCDNCGTMFRDYSSDFTIYLSESTCIEYMDNNEWYTGFTDPEHSGRHYCSNCYEPHPDIDDKIILDTTRTQL